MHVALVFLRKQNIFGMKKNYLENLGKDFQAKNNDEKSQFYECKL